MSPEEWARIRTWDPDFDNPDPSPGPFPRPRVSPWIVFGMWLGVAAAFGTILGLTLP